MAINGVLSKLMFERNPEREFYVEESFPLNSMYPHLSPHGLILKINRQRPSELSSDVVQSDREYWTRYIGPMIGDWLNFDSSLPEIVPFVERVYQYMADAKYKLALVALPPSPEYPYAPLPATVAR